MKSVLTIGGAVHDIFIQYPQPIRSVHNAQFCITIPEGKKVEVTAVSHYSGGGGTNSAASFKRLGFHTSAFFKIGADEAGDFVRSELITENINISHAISTEQADTGTSYILQSSSGNHPILVDRGANLTLTAEELPLEVIKNVDLVYVTSLSGSTASLLPIIAETAKKSGTFVATNPGTSQLKGNAQALYKSLPWIDILILNAYEASILFNAFIQPKTPCTQAPNSAKAPELATEFVTCDNKKYTIYDYFKHILSAGVKITVVTNGAEGVYVATDDIRFFHPSIKTEIINSVGAGDAFASTFVAEYVQGKPIETAIRAGIINSSSVLHYLGAKTGLLNAQELQEQLAHFDQSLLKKI